MKIIMVCQNCKNKFTIEPEDFQFYEKIDVPPPTWCPECRSQRRYLFRNERSLYKRKCSFTGKEIISRYTEDTPFPVYETTIFYSDQWAPPSLEYNPQKPFLEQLKELSDITPRPALLTDIASIENGSEYQNAASRNKNCYMVFASGDNEDCSYGSSMDYCKTCVDGLWLLHSELSYDCIDCYNSSRLFFCQETRYCSSSYFLFNCRNCTNCFGCVGLRHKSYCFFNQQLTKEDYEKKIKTILESLTRDVIKDYKQKLHALSLTKPHKYAHIDITVNCTGDFLVNSRNVKNSFMAFDCEDCRYCTKLIKGKSCYDVNDWGDPAELCYESITIGKNVYRCFFSNNCWPGCHDIQYCDTCSSSEYLFGCIGLKNASYCILNKHYSKKDYEVLISKIIKKMKKDKEYGEFFPIEFSPFAYNETIAQEWFPLTKKEAEKKKYSWKDQEEKNYQPTLSWKNLPKSINNVKDSIINELILCQAWDENLKEAQLHNCTKVFRVISDELKFYKQFKLPLPIKCPNTRHYERMQQRNPLKLWHRQCVCDYKIYKNTTTHQHHPEGHCPNEFETSYSPERKEIVYCESCYNSEVI